MPLRPPGCTISPSGLIKPLPAALIVSCVFFPLCTPLALRRLHKVTHALVTAATGIADCDAD
jgi:hypothetical protein